MKGKKLLNKRKGTGKKGREKEIKRKKEGEKNGKKMSEKTKSLVELELGTIRFVNGDLQTK